VVRPSATSVHVGRHTTLTVRVSLRGAPLKGVRVVAMNAGRRLASTRTAADGKARLKLKTAKRGTVRLKVAGRVDCGSTSLRVVR
jgi:hypothetical protein